VGFFFKDQMGFLAKYNIFIERKSSFDGINNTNKDLTSENHLMHLELRLPFNSNLKPL